MGTKQGLFILWLLYGFSELVVAQETDIPMVLLQNFSSNNIDLNENVSLTKCGVNNVSGVETITFGNSGDKARFGEFPWTVAILDNENNNGICMGSLIHPKAVLTTNHCVRKYSTQPEAIKIRAGQYDLSTINESVVYQESIAHRIFSHPEYGTRNLTHDFAIIELEAAFELNKAVNTICLPPSAHISQIQDCFVSGWIRNDFGKSEESSIIMRKAEVSIVSSDQCVSALRKTRLGRLFNLHPSFICGAEKNVCKGQGGSPLACPVGSLEDKRYTLSGMVAWGLVECGNDSTIPGAYANVASGRDWIDSQMKAINLDISYYTY